ncbi:MAG: hypothetical protein Q8M83_00720 [bacterium]|nr:hypothetical protein [bacterium]
MTIREFIKKRPYLIWYTKDFDHLSTEAIVESILQYGDFDDVKQFIKLLGVRNIARIFKTQIKGPRVNYDPKIVNFFKLYFKKHGGS